MKLNFNLMHKRFLKLSSLLAYDTLNLGYVYVNVTLQCIYISGTSKSINTLNINDITDDLKIGYNYAV